jgi:hypothetical protein
MFVRAAGKPAARSALTQSPAPPDMRALGVAALAHGIELLGPPGMLPGELPPPRHNAMFAQVTSQPISGQAG